MATTTLQEQLQKLLSGQEHTSPKEPAATDFKSLGEMRAFLSGQFPNISPSPEEYYSGMLQAFKSAANRLQRHQAEMEKQERIERAKKMWTYDEMREQALTMGAHLAEKEKWKRPFVIDEHNEHVFHLLCLYFTNNPEFEQYEHNGVKYSLNKGIWLQSEVRGSGKTALLRCFSVNKRSCFGYIHTTQIGNLFVRNGFHGIDPYMSTTPQHPTSLNFYQQEAGFMYDEMFSEEVFNGWGTQLYPSKYIINSLYDFNTNKKGELWKFHITSNFDGNDIEKVAGKTIRSRMPDMWNLIKLGGVNRRV